MFSFKLSRLFTFLLGLVILAVGLFLFLTSAGVSFFTVNDESKIFTETLSAPQVDLSDFEAGNLLSDQVLYNYESMTYEEIDGFIAEHNRGCQAVNVPCLADYTEDTKEIPPSDRCAGYEGELGESAAQIIYKTAQSCRINPQVLLVLLQKEQGLITATADQLTSRRYEVATGFGCPDGQECDSRYYGFAAQVYYAAAQFQRYRQHPDMFRYRGGDTYRIAYAPVSGCASAEVRIQNQATASLYNYTPYQPDPDLLKGLPGECSSYGNANFFGIFKSWFGDPRAE